MTAKDELPPAKFYAVNIRDVMRRKRDITDVLTTNYLDYELPGTGLYQLAEAVGSKLPQSIPRKVLLESLQHLVGTMLTKEVIVQEAWRLAGNVRQLRTGYSVSPWRRQEVAEWVPIQVGDCQLLRTQRGKFGGKFKSRILAGRSCGLTVDKFWTKKFCNYLSSLLGFDPPWKEFRFTRLHEFVQMRLYVQLEPSDSDGRDLWFDKVKINKAFVEYNRQLLAARYRHGKFKCPFKYKHACYQCHVGYDQCSVATHPTTFVKDLCSVCHKKEWMDPRGIAFGVCVSCQTKRDTRNSKPE